MSYDYAYWNTPDDSGVTRRQRKWAEEVGVDATVGVLASLPCLCSGHGRRPRPWHPACCGVAGGKCVTCEARVPARWSAMTANDGYRKEQ